MVRHIRIEEILIMYHIYFLSMLIAFISGVTFNKKYQLFFLLFITSVSILFFGLRWHSGADFDGYLLIYDSVPLLGGFNLGSVKYIHGELGFLFVTSLIKTLGTPNFIYMFTLTCISIGLKAYFFYKESILPVFSLSLYFLFLGMTFEFVQIRYALALSFLLLSLYYLINGFKRKSVLFFLFSISFHYFTAIFVVMYFYKRLKIKNHHLYFLSLLVFVIVSNSSIAVVLLDLTSDLLGGTTLGRRATGYIGGAEHYSVSVQLTSFLVIRAFLFTGVAIYFFKFYNSGDEKFEAYLKVNLLFLLLSVSFSFNSIMFSRAVVVVELVNFLLVGFCISKSKSLKDRLLMLSLFLVLAGLSFIKALDSENIYSYQTWLGVLF